MGPFIFTYVNLKKDHQHRYMSHTTQVCAPWVNSVTEIVRDIKETSTMLTISIILIIRFGVLFYFYLTFSPCACMDAHNTLMHAFNLLSFSLSLSPFFHHFLTLKPLSLRITNLPIYPQISKHSLLYLVNAKDSFLHLLFWGPL